MFVGKAGIVGLTTHRRVRSPLIVWVEGEEGNAEQEKALEQIRKKAGGLEVKVYRTGVSVQKPGEGRRTRKDGEVLGTPVGTIKKRRGRPAKNPPAKRWW